MERCLYVCLHIFYLPIYIFNLPELESTNLKNFRKHLPIFEQKLSEYNLELERQIEKMKEEMMDGKNEIDKTTDDYLKLKVSLLEL